MCSRLQGRFYGFAACFLYLQKATMKLIIQIPCFNEEETIGQVLAELPREIPGVADIEYLVIDDGSIDNTISAARQAGANHILSLNQNQGYGRAFLAGFQKCRELGADIVVNTDGDNQYRGSSIPDLIRPIVAKKADIVIGARPIDKIKEFSWLKKKLQRLGSAVARSFSGTDVPDATSGFRAYSAEAAMRLHIISPYSHSLETIIQAGHMGLTIASVPIAVNPKTRESRLMNSMWHYILRTGAIILHSYVQHKPMKTFFFLSLPPAFVGIAIGIRFLVYFLFSENPTGGIQSLILAAILLIVAFNLFTLGIVAELSGTNRKLIQELLYTVRNRRWAKKSLEDE